MYRLIFFCFLSYIFQPAQTQSTHGNCDSLVWTINQKILQHNKVNSKKLIGPHIYADENKSSGAILLPTLHYEYKITELDGQTPIKLEFNGQVQHYIELYLTRRWSELPEIIGLSTYYFPIIEEILVKHNLPIELKYLVFVESGFDPFAVSRSGAVGLWQFKYNSGKMFDLTIDSFVDERRDPVKSTEAAAKYLTYLYNTFSDWQLAIAAFNGGPGEIRNAIQRSGGKTNFWELSPYLAKQTKNYLPAFIAAIYIFSNYSEHGIYPIKPGFDVMQTECIEINQPLQFQQITSNINISMDKLRWLNPTYKSDMVPATASGSTLVIPTALVPAFIASVSKIYGNKIESDDYHSIKEKGARTEGKKLIFHVVEKGEFFHLIAMKYGCTIENIKTWNQLESNFLYPGQKLKIWVER